MVLGTRANSASSKKGAASFRAINSDDELSVSQTQLNQAAASAIAVDNLPSAEVGTTIERIDLQSAAAQGASQVLSGLSNSLNDANSASGASGRGASLPKNSSLKSLEDMGMQPTTNGGPGSVVNVLI
jgi:hypothetical protein